MKNTDHGLALEPFVYLVDFRYSSDDQLFVVNYYAIFISSQIIYTQEIMEG